MQSADRRFTGKTHIALKVAILLISIGMPCLGVWFAVTAGLSAAAGLLIPALLVPFLLLAVLGISIRIADGAVVIHYIVFKVRIPIKDIQIVNDTAVNKRLTLVAMNFAQGPGWLEIGYGSGGKIRWVTLSPADKADFMRTLAEADPRLVLNDAKLERVK